MTLLSLWSLEKKRDMFKKEQMCSCIIMTLCHVTSADVAEQV